MHSPFVYHLVTRCFYNQEKKASNATLKTWCKEFNIPLKAGKLINRIPNYFKCENALVFEEAKPDIFKLLTLNTNLTVNFQKQPNRSYDLIYCTVYQLQAYINNQSLRSIAHNDSIFVLYSVYASKETKTIWDNIKEHPKIKVTVDTFYFCFVFIRKEQAKEHFMIRL
ncbi:hypothetical protein J8281_08705 [Aquimarina sp. U1-2]|uniref:hypothetical protein n=1 Tax=Aquimarina sp. U1-2 TaxID=2823141 RepID=UPI001AEC87DE|nr:hypothetical protein [Aquimarina sp. U1-2]MBP2832264.1 hypothetical protein [Aquimarina sp. U1-2]